MKLLLAEDEKRMAKALRALYELGSGILAAPEEGSRAVGYVRVGVYADPGMLLVCGRLGVHRDLVEYIDGGERSHAAYYAYDFSCHDLLLCIGPAPALRRSGILI